MENLHVDFLRLRDVDDRNAMRRCQETFAGSLFMVLRPGGPVKLQVGRERDFDAATRIVEQNHASLNRSYLYR